MGQSPAQYRSPLAGPGARPRRHALSDPCACLIGWPRSRAVGGPPRHGDRGGRGDGMIGEVDEALRTLVREAVDSPDVEVVLDAPTKDWAARRNAPTVDVYLYDLREDLRRRTRGEMENRVEGRVSTRYQPPRHFRLSYLVTAWTQRPEDEHRLLDAALRHLLRFDALPSRVLDDQLARAGARVPLFVGLPPPEDRGFADVWTALG